jgi:hypothetical protein
MPDLARLADLKELLLNAREFSKVWEYFLDHFGGDPDFIALGERVRPPLLEAVLAQVGQQLFRCTVDVQQLLLTGLPEHQFVHGGGPVGGGLMNVLYFEDIQTGMIVALTSLAAKQTQFARFGSARPMPIGKPSLN